MKNNEKKDQEEQLLQLYNEFHNDDRLLRAWAEENNHPDPDALVALARGLHAKRAKRNTRKDLSGAY